jgi:large subunit ribosomal protein L18
MNTSEKISKRYKRKRRVRKNIFGTEETPRVAVYRSNKHIYAQVIDDEDHKTLVSANDYEVNKKGTKSEIAEEVGKNLGKKAKSKKIKKVKFDRGGYKYHGRVKALADGLRSAGIKF